MYGSYPQFICCSATVANPKEHICKLLPIDCMGGVDKLTVLDASSDGSPSYEKRLLLWNPKLKASKESTTLNNFDLSIPVDDSTSETTKSTKTTTIKTVNHNDTTDNGDSLQEFLMGCENNVRTIEGFTKRAENYKNGKKREITVTKSNEQSETKESKKLKVASSFCSNKEHQERTSTIVETSLVFSSLVKRKIRTLAFCKVRKLVELVLLYTLQDLRTSAPHLCETVDSYRGGYTKAERRRIESGTIIIIIIIITTIIITTTIIIITIFIIKICFLANC